MADVPQQVVAVVEDLLERLGRASTGVVLSVTQRLIERLSADQLTAIHKARTEGMTWEQIGRLLGTNRQSAWRRAQD